MPSTNVEAEETTAAERPLGTPASERVLRTRGRQTMGKLLDAGRDVVARQGHQTARVDDIVKLASLSHGTFYLYFTDKDDLLRALAEECVEEIVQLVVSLGPVGPDAAGFRELRAWLERFLDTYREWGAVIRVFLEKRQPDRRLADRGTAAFRQIRTALGVRLEEAGGIDGSPGLGAIALLAMIERYAYVIVSRDPGVPDDEMLDTLARLVHRGFFGGK